MKNLLIVLGVASVISKDLKDLPGPPIYEYIENLTSWFKVRDYEIWNFTDQEAALDGLNLQLNLRNNYVEGDEGSPGLYNRDRIIVYFIGHGIHDSGQYWLLTDGYEQSHSRIDVTQMRKNIETYGPQQISIFSDACASGVNLKTGGISLFPKAKFAVEGSPELNQFYASAQNVSTYAHKETGPYFSQIVKAAILEDEIPPQARDPLYLAVNQTVVTDRSLTEYIKQNFAGPLARRNKYVKADLMPGFSTNDIYRKDIADTDVLPLSDIEEAARKNINAVIQKDLKKIHVEKVSTETALKLNQVQKKVDFPYLMENQNAGQIVFRNKKTKIFSTTTYGVFSANEAPTITNIKGLGPVSNIGGDIVSSEQTTMSVPHYRGKIVILDSKKKALNLTGVLDETNKQSKGLNIIKSLAKEAIYPETLERIMSDDPNFLASDPLGILAAASVNYLYGTRKQKVDLVKKVVQETSTLSIDEALALELKIEYDAVSQSLKATHSIDHEHSAFDIKPIIPTFRFSWARLSQNRLPQIFDDLIPLIDKLDNTMISRFSDTAARVTLKKWLNTYFSNL